MAGKANDIDTAITAKETLKYDLYLIQYASRLFSIIGCVGYACAASVPLYDAPCHRDWARNGLLWSFQIDAQAVSALVCAKGATPARCSGCRLAQMFGQGPLLGG